MPKGQPFAPETWDAIRPRWNAGAESLKAIAADYGMAGFTITVHARIHGWPPRPRLVAVGHRHSQKVPLGQRPKAAPKPRKYVRKPGERICSRCHGRTMKNPSSCCDAPSREWKR